MLITYVVHIAAGTLGLIAGYIALYSAKGAAVHRQSGRLFVYAMLAMAIAGMTIAVLRNRAPEINIPAGLITSYFVITSLATVRPSGSSRRARLLEVGGLILALAVGLTMMTFGFDAVANGGKRHGFPAFPYFMFAAFSLLGAAGDLRVLWGGPRKGTQRLARHLWRMSMALFIAALSFAVQMIKIASRYVHVPRGAMAVPMLLVLVPMFYWLWRIRIRRRLRGIVMVGAPEAA